MRTTLPVVLLLLGASSAQGQADTSGPAVAFTAPAPAQVPAQALPAAAPARPAAPTRPRTPARAEAATTVEEAEAQEPKKRSRVVWILVGAVIVLAIIVAAR